MLLLVLLWVAPFVFGSSPSGPLVQTKYGKLRGFYYPLPNNQSARVFLGVRFAKAPVGSLRFEKPQPPPKFNGIYDATSFGARPIPNPYPTANQSEDCLFLNIIAPPNPNPSSKYPVLFYIYGGAYEVGSADLFGYSFYAEKYASQGVIVVTANYRLGFLSFLTTGDSRLPGNLGLFDNALTIQYIKDNIKNFGGDPNKITLWGQSGGAISASLLTLSPLTRNKVVGAISHSALAWNAVALDEQRTLNFSLQIIANVGCPNDANIKTCLRSKTPEEFQAAVTATGPTPYRLSLARFSARIDGDLLPAKPDVLVRQGQPKKWLIGNQDLEDVVWTILRGSGIISQYNIYDNQTLTYGPSDLSAFFAAIIATPEFFGNKSSIVQQVLEQRYLVNLKPANADYKYYLTAYTEILSQLHFQIGTRRAAYAIRQNGGKAFVYRWDYIQPIIFTNSSPVIGAPHANDGPYQLGVFSFGAFNFTNDDYAVQNATVAAVLAFAKTGNPSTPSLAWPAVTAQKPDQFLQILPQSVVQQGFYSEEAAFWDALSDCGSKDIVDFFPNPPSIQAAIKCNQLINSYLG